MGVFVVMVMCSRMVFMFVVPAQMDIEFYAGNPAFLPSSEVKMVSFQAELHQRVFQCLAIHTQVHQSANKHVSADSAEQIQIQRFHFRPCRTPSSSAQMR